MSKMHPFLIVSYAVKLAIRLIPPYLLVLIFRSSAGLKTINEHISGTIISILGCSFIMFGFVKWFTLRYSIQDDQVIVKNFSFLQQTVEYIDERKVVNCVTTKWFPSNMLGISDLRIQLEGDEDEATISLPAIREQDRLAIMNALKAEETNSDFIKRFQVTPREVLGGLITRGLIFTLFVIFLSTLVSNISKSETWEGYFSIEFWIQGIANLPGSVYMYASALLIMSLIAQYSKAINFNLQMDDQQIKIVSGAFSKKIVSIYIKNIKGLMVQQTLVQKLFKRSTLYIETIDQEQRKILLHPFVKNEDIPMFIKLCYREDIHLKEEKWNKQGGRHAVLLIYLTAFFITGLCLYMLAEILFPVGILALLILCSIKVMKHWSVKFQIEADHLIVEQGVFIKKTHILQNAHLQYVKTRKMPWHHLAIRHVQLGYFNNSVRKRIKLKSIHKNHLHLPLL